MQPDKIKHMKYGFLIAFIASFINAPLGFLLAVAVGVGKEVICDMKLQKGTPEFADAIATLLGAVIGAALSVITKGLIINYLL